MEKNANIIFAWIWIFFGVVSGMALGLFVFNGPLVLSDDLMDYSSLTRRFLRLAHISFFGLGLINWLYGISIYTLKLSLEKTTSLLYIVGGITMPLFLSISAFYEPFKYALSIPASCVFLALILTLRSILMRDKKAK